MLYFSLLSLVLCYTSNCQGKKKSKKKKCFLNHALNPLKILSATSYCILPMTTLKQVDSIENKTFFFRLVNILQFSRQIVVHYINSVTDALGRVSPFILSIQIGSLFLFSCLSCLAWKEEGLSSQRQVRDDITKCAFVKEKQRSLAPFFLI